MATYDNGDKSRTRLALAKANGSHCFHLESMLPPTGDSPNYEGYPAVLTVWSGCSVECGPGLAVMGWLPPASGSRK